jgi:hypothetical protein
MRDPPRKLAQAITLFTFMCFESLHRNLICQCEFCSDTTECISVGRLLGCFIPVAPTLSIGHP